MFASILAEHRTLLERFDASCADTVRKVGEAMVAVLASGHKLLICGNGGSAADAQHFAAEIIGRFETQRAALPAIALTTDSSILTAVGNDYGFDEVFARQVAGLGNKGDLLVAISTSGRSPNVLKAIAAARTRQMSIAGLTGHDGGDMPRLCDQCVVIPHPQTARIQEMHILTIHIWCAMIDAALTRHDTTQSL